MAIPSSANNLFALDFSVAESVTTSADGITLVQDQGPSGNDFFNDHPAAGSQPQLSGVLAEFDGGQDHLHNDGSPLFPATADWTWIWRGQRTPLKSGPRRLMQQLNPSSYSNCFNLFSQPNSAGIWKNAILLDPADAPGSIPEGTENTVVIQRVSGEFLMRVNGVQVSSSSGASVVEIGQGGVLMCAEQGGTTGTPWDTQWNPAAYFPGSVQRVGLWDVALSGTDLTDAEDWATNGVSASVIFIPPPLLTGAYL